MILKFDLPKQAVSCISLSEDEKIYYAVPYDISEDGSWVDDS